MFTILCVNLDNVNALLESAAYALEKIQDKLSGSSSSPSPALSGGINGIIGFEAKPDPFTYNHREVILYALGGKVTCTCIPFASCTLYMYIIIIIHICPLFSWFQAFP